MFHSTLQCCRNWSVQESEASIVGQSREDFLVRFKVCVRNDGLFAACYRVITALNHALSLLLVFADEFSSRIAIVADVGLNWWLVAHLVGEEAREQEQG